MNAVNTVPRCVSRQEKSTSGRALCLSPLPCPTGASRLPSCPPGRPGEESGHELGDDPEAMYFLAATLLAGQRAARAAPMLRRLDTITASRGDRRLWRRRVEFLWAAHAERSADSAGVLDHCRAAEDPGEPSCDASVDPTLEPDQPGCLHPVDAMISEELPLLTIRAHTRVGHAALAQTLLESHFGSQEAAEAIQPATVALIACEQGRLSDAQRLATAALQVAESSEGLADLTELDARQVLAEVFFERNELDAARDQLEAAQRRCWSTGALPGLWAVEVDLIRVLIARRRAEEALQRLYSLRHALGAALATSPIRPKLHQADIDARLVLGDLDGALDVARDLTAQELGCDVSARLDLCAGRPERALSRLESDLPANLAAQVRHLVLRACADRQQGRQQRALDAIRQAVYLARPDRYVRPFLEAPTLTLPLLRGLSHSDPEPYLSQLIAQGQALVDRADVEPPGMLEPLTEREGQVLRHLASHYNLPQIADLMIVSTNTIKTHVKAIYRKMGAASRHEAITIARGHGLLV